MIFFPDSREQTLPKANIEPAKGLLKKERHLQNHQLLDSMNVPCELFSGISKISLFKHINATTKKPTVDPPALSVGTQASLRKEPTSALDRGLDFQCAFEPKTTALKKNLMLIWLVPDLIQQQVFWSDTNWILSMNNKVIELVGG